MPALRGTDPTSSAQLVLVNACSRSLVASMPASKRERAVVEFHDDALERLHRRLDLQESQHDGRIGSE